MAENKIETLEERRKTALQKFAQKTVKNKKFGKKWFLENDDLPLRCREKYKILRCSSEREQNNPLNCMRRILNKLTKDQYDLNKDRNQNA